MIILNSKESRLLKMAMTAELLCTADGKMPFVTFYGHLEKNEDTYSDYHSDAESQTWPLFFSLFFRF